MLLQMTGLAETIPYIFSGACSRAGPGSAFQSHKVAFWCDTSAQCSKWPYVYGHGAPAISSLSWPILCLTTASLGSRVSPSEDY